MRRIRPLWLITVLAFVASALVAVGAPTAAQAQGSCTISGTTLSWSHVGASDYNVRKNGSWYRTVNGTSTTIDDPGASWIVRHRANGQTVDRSCSPGGGAPAPAPQGGCTLNGNQLSWSDVGQDEYYVQKNGSWFRNVRGLTTTIDNANATWAVRHWSAGDPIDRACSPGGGGGGGGGAPAPAPAPAPQGGCELNGNQLSWSDVGKDEYYVQKNGSWFRNVRGLTTTVDTTKATWAVRHWTGGNPVDRACTVADAGGGDDGDNGLGWAPRPDERFASCKLGYTELSRQTEGVDDARRLKVRYEWFASCTGVHVALGAQSVALELRAHGPNGAQQSPNFVVRGCDPTCEPEFGRPNQNFLKASFIETMYVNIASCNQRVRVLSGLLDGVAGAPVTVKTTTLAHARTADFTFTGTRIETSQVCFEKGGDSAKLAADMTRAGRPRPGAGYEAHHIVPVRACGTGLTQILDGANVWINANANGAWLTEAAHDALHNDAGYCNWVEARLQAARGGRPLATSKARIKTELRAIGQLIERGQTPWR